MLRRTINGCMIDFIVGIKMMAWDTRAMGFVVDVTRGYHYKGLGSVVY